MGRQGDPTRGMGSTSSSIALLQERFRQLEKIREKREEKELLKLFPEPDRAGSTKRYDWPNRLLLTSRQTQKDSLALGLSRPNDFQAMEIPAPTSLRPNGAAASSTSQYLENPDVDTSLRL